MRRQFYIFIIFLLIFSIILLFLYDYRISTNVSSIPKSCFCADRSGHLHNFCYPSKLDNFKVFGRKFDCKWLPILERLQLLKKLKNISKFPIKDSTFVTGSSDNHFYELRKSVGSVQSVFPNATTVFYDLGLDAKEAVVAKKFCHVNYRAFRFSHYPQHVEKLSQYRWKPLIIAQSLVEFPAFWWFDTSTRWINSSLDLQYKLIESKRKADVLLLDRSGHSIFAATNPKMYRYLPTNQEKAKEVPMLGANLIFVNRNDESREILKWWVLCALEPDCMAPPESHLSCVWKTSERFKTNADCHRFDQSALSILLSNKFAYDSATYSVDYNYFVEIRRDTGGPPIEPKLC